MAEKNDQEKTEQPTGRRLDEARGKGQVALSKELVAAVTFLVTLAAIRLGGGTLVETLAGVCLEMFRLPDVLWRSLEDPNALIRHVGEVTLAAILPVFLAALGAVWVTGFVQIGFRITLQPLEPKFDKLDPTAGVKRLFGLDNLVLTLSSVLKFILVGIVVWVTIEGSLDRIAGLGGRDVVEDMFVLIELMFLLCWRVAAGLVVLGIFDLLYRRWKHTKDLMMSKQDVKDESKQSEGDPHVKGKIREIQRKMALTRMKSDVQGATVVVRNPTHFAVALKYDDDMQAPRVVAKGRALMALTIIRLAEEAGVEVIENRPLARELYRSVRVGDWIPDRLFKAVAEVIAHVYRKKRRKPARAAGAGA